MLKDPVATAGLVAREVRSGTRDGAPTRVAVARRTYPTGREDLWQALTQPERIVRWFLPVSGDLRVGGTYRTEGNASGSIESCVAPERFDVTWEFGDVVSWLAVSLSETGEGTLLELTHESPVDPVFWEQFGPGAVGVGWDLALMGLGLHLETGAAVDPAEAAAFATSPEGIEYVRAAATGWAHAAVADGDEPGPAHEAAVRTLAFYTTVPEDTSGS
ncbi:SRPBCC family protein [Motilibacter aurantiacus]|uniref:SRPBCC family protein n=1 Tax=Motilibacter aurantiacus TaxID=2714955 RepID=UPI001407565A|nr:SRPBCC family protein [Motilibacter aurantiacus]NHC46802.1 SRPBCC family protein [Motilibacter aurantiacus]